MTFHWTNRESETQWGHLKTHEMEVAFEWDLEWKKDSLEKTLMLGKIEGRKKRGWQRTREMVGWHHRLDGHKFEQASGIGNAQRSLACCSPSGHKESDATEWLNWTELEWKRTSDGEHRMVNTWMKKSNGEIAMVYVERKARNKAANTCS